MQGRILHAHLASQRRTRILELGCSTGALTCELARRYPLAQVVGVDVEPGPSRPDTPANVEFIDKDINTLSDDDDRLESGSFDYVFSRLLIFRVKKWPIFVRAAGALLKPRGWMEIQDMTNLFYKHHDHVSGAWDWSWTIDKAAKAHSMDLMCGEWAKEWMEHGAYLDKVCQRMYDLPVGTWMAEVSTVLFIARMFFEGLLGGRIVGTDLEAARDTDFVSVIEEAGGTPYW